jgi:hypothetical protein
MKYFSSCDILFVRAVYCYLRWPRSREQNITAPGDPLSRHNKLPSSFPLYLCFPHVIICHARTNDFIMRLTLRNMVLTVLSKIGYSFERCTCLKKPLFWWFLSCLMDFHSFVRCVSSKLMLSNLLCWNSANKWCVISNAMWSARTSKTEETDVRIVLNLRKLEK